VMFNVRRFVGWIGQDTVAAVSPEGTVSLQVIPLPAAVVRPYEPRAGDVVEVVLHRVEE
jgi:hypothetical protein